MLLRLFYYFLKLIIPILVHLYYRITFINKQNFNLPSGACIMTSNHPNTLIDVLMSVPFVNRRSHFLANASLFKHPFFNWMWRKLWCIPIKRRKDDVENVNNDDSFEACDTFLSGGGLLFIAPEGTSYNERHLREFRPGTAKIAFSAEAKNNFQLGLTICCFGLSYDRPWRFRSRVYVNASEPIRVADYRENYEKDPEAAINFLTQVIENQTRMLIVDAADLKQDRLLAQIEQLNDSNFWYQKGRWLSPNERFKNAQQIVTNLKSLQHNEPENYINLENNVNQYFNSLEKYHLSEKNLATSSAKGSWIITILLAILNFPFFFVGLIFNLLPYLIVEGIWRKLRLEAYEATVRIGLGGLIIFPIGYWLSVKLISHWVHFPFIGLLFWSLAILLGIFAWNYIEFIQFHIANFRLARLKPDLRQKIENERATTLAKIQKQLSI